MHRRIAVDFFKLKQTGVSEMWYVTLSINFCDTVVKLNVAFTAEPNVKNYVAAFETEKEAENFAEYVADNFILSS